MKSTAGLIGLVAMLLAFLPPASAGNASPPAETAAKPDEKPVPEAKVWVTKHQIRMGGTTIAYTATAGTMLMKND